MAAFPKSLAFTKGQRCYVKKNGGFVVKVLDGNSEVLVSILAPLQSSHEIAGM